MPLQEPKMFNWSASYSVSDLKEYIKHLKKEKRQLDSLEHDLNIRKSYEQACEKVHHEIKLILEQLGGEATETSSPECQPGDIGLGTADGRGMLSTVVKENIEKLKTAFQTNQNQTLQIQQQLTQSQNNLTQKTTELNQTQDLNAKLQQDNRDLLKDIQNYKQKIANLEQTITQQKSLLTQHLTQEKAQLTKEITLIKEVLHA